MNATTRNPHDNNKIMTWNIILGHDYWRSQSMIPVYSVLTEKIMSFGKPKISRNQGLKLRSATPASCRNPLVSECPEAKLSSRLHRRHRTPGSPQFDTDKLVHGTSWDFSFVMFLGWYRGSVFNCLSIFSNAFPRPGRCFASSFWYWWLFSM
jgi:hypothetical protein